MLKHPYPSTHGLLSPENRRILFGLRALAEDFFNAALMSATGSPPPEPCPTVF